jgi:hypothetical protein
LARFPAASLVTIENGERILPWASIGGDGCLARSTDRQTEHSRACNVLIAKGRDDPPTRQDGGTGPPEGGAGAGRSVIRLRRQDGTERQQGQRKAPGGGHPSIIARGETPRYFVGLRTLGGDLSNFTNCVIFIPAGKEFHIGNVTLYTYRNALP